MESSDVEVDVLVVGSGAGALTAALTARIEGADVLVVEKSDLYGGTSAMSGGGIWIPDSHYVRAMSEVDDSKQEALDYLCALIGEDAEMDRLEAYVDKAPEMLEYLANNSRLECEPIEYSDYYPEKKGGKSGFRTHQPLPMHARHLGREFDTLRGQHPQTLVAGRLTMTMKEARQFLTRSRGWWWAGFKLFAGYFLDIPGRLKSKRARRLALGNALVGRLRWSLMDRGVDLWLNTPMQDLITQDNKVLGAVVTRDGRQLNIRARRGVILGAGGFEHNLEMRNQYLPKPTNPDWSGSQECNTGDAIQAGMAIGAAIHLMEHAWWVPAIKIPRWERPYVLFAERSNPGLILVNKAGKRFYNEAAPYLEAGAALYAANSDEARTIPSYVIFDANFRRKYVFSPPDTGSDSAGQDGLPGSLGNPDQGRHPGRDCRKDRCRIRRVERNSAQEQ